MAAPLPGAWGIDLGQCALKAVRIENINGVPTATAFDYVEHPKILSQPDADPDQLTREALEKFLSRNSLRGDIVAVSIPGQSGLARFVKLPPVEEKKITDIVKFEAKQQIPFNLEEVVWDYQKIGSGIVTDGFAMETEIGLFAIKRDMVFRALQHFQDVEVEVNIIQMAPLSLCNYVSYDLLNKEGLPVEGEGDEGGKKPCVVALDIGVESSNLVITDGERVIWQRPIPIGGNRFTRALTKDLKLTFAKAEHLKRNATKSPDLKRILMALKPDLNEFVNEVQKSLNFFTNSHRDAQIQYLVGMGSAFRLPGLQKYLGEKLGLDVRKLQKFNRLQGDSVVTAPVFTENILSFGVAYGLAAQGLKLSRLQTNLLPTEIQTERLIRAKKPWAVAAAAALLVGAAALTMGYKLEHEAVASPSIKQAMEQDGKKALEDVTSWQGKCSAEQKKVTQLEKDVGRILAGQDERVNWLKMHKFVNDCLPRPDGANLTEKQKKDYWTSGKDGKGGEDSWNKFKKANSAVKADASADGEESLKYLCSVNLEGVSTLYTDDLSGYFNRLRDSQKALPGMPEKDKTAPPKGPGWVVEVRGFTYHDGQHQFLLDTFVDNLATRGAVPAAPETPKGPAKKDPKGDPKAEATKPAEEPVEGKVSHVCLYRFAPNKVAFGADFELVRNSVLMPLVTGQAAAAPGTGPAPPPLTPPPGPGGATGGKPGVSAGPAFNVSRSGWKPLGNDPSVFNPKAVDKIIGGTATTGQETVERTKKGEYVRTEFIILFIWQEPTPSDLLKTGGAAPATPTPATPLPKN